MRIHGIRGTFFIGSSKTLEETAEIVNRVTNLDLKRDDSGYYEEFPAYSNHVIGIQFALLGPPKEEYRNKDQNYEKYDFLIMDNHSFKNSDSIDLAPNLIMLLNLNSELECFESK